MIPPPRTCSVCQSPNFKTCECPWKLDFTRWPQYLLARLRKLVETDGLRR